MPAWVLIVARKKSQTVDLQVAQRGQFVSVVMSHYPKWDHEIWLAFIISEHLISILNSDLLMGKFSSTLVSRKYPERKMIVPGFGTNFWLSGFSAALIGMNLQVLLGPYGSYILWRLDSLVFPCLSFQLPKEKRRCFSAMSINMLKITKHSSAMVMEAI